MKSPFKLPPNPLSKVKPRKPSPAPLLTDEDLNKIKIVDAEEDEILRSIPNLSEPNEELEELLVKAKESDDGMEKWLELSSNKAWRMDHFYSIINEQGKKVPFFMNKAQKLLFDFIWWMNLILKDRQRGFTTFIDLYILDDCLFTDNMEAGIIAHNLVEAQKIFRRKVKFPYDTLPAEIKAKRFLVSDSKSELAFNNGSLLSVSTSMRSGTYQRLHVSEFGKICAHFPDKASEIVAGGLESLHEDSILFIESTAEGSGGKFFEYCQAARKLEGDMRNGIRKEMNRLDWKLFFFAWWSDPKKRLEADIVVPAALSEYLDRVEASIPARKDGSRRTLDAAQRAWYTQKKLILGDDMASENPSTFEEAFEKDTKGAFFGSEMAWLVKEGRITKVDLDPNVKVDTWWDLGMNDINAIWFTQRVGLRLHVVDYFESHSEGFKFYRKVFDNKGYNFGTHNAPHDISVREWGNDAKTRFQSAKECGINFERVPKTDDKMDSINAARRIMAICWFDAGRCDEGLNRLRNYRREWDERLLTFKNRPRHDINSNGADAFQTLACGFELVPRDYGIMNLPTSMPSMVWS